MKTFRLQLDIQTDWTCEDVATYLQSVARRVAVGQTAGRVEDAQGATIGTFTTTPGVLA